MNLLCYIIGILLTFIIVSLILKKGDNVNCDVWLFITVVIVSLLFPIFWLTLIGHQLAEKWRKWVSK